jgi:acyl carrier protein
VVPIGRPMSNIEIYILDEQLQPVPVGVAGELHIGGVGLARGYLNRADLTEQKFIPDPFRHGTPARLYKTGDRARYLPDGNIEFLGRMDQQVKVRGFRIELGEIETVLLQSPLVRECAVLAREDVAGDKRLVAYVVPRQGCDLSPAELRSFLREKLPEYMVPAHVVMLQALPLTPNGKVDRQALPAPRRRSPELGEEFAPPHTRIEEVLASIWCQILGVDTLGTNENFFEAGGHSLLATQLVSRIRDAFQVELPLRTIFESPTIAELATKIEALFPDPSPGADIPGELQNWMN